MEDVLQTIDIQKFKSLFPENFGLALGNDFYIAELHHEKALRFLSFPVRLNAYIALFCIDGHISFDINLSSYEVCKHSLLISIPGNIIRTDLADKGSWAGNHFLLVAMSKEFVSTLHFDMNKLFEDSISIFDNPSITLDGTYLQVCTDYINLIESILKIDMPGKNDIMSSLMTSLFYTYASIWQQKINEMRPAIVAAGPSERNKTVFEQFLRLVTINHSKERNMSFYSDKLNLTPKYLSKVVKTVSGRSAPHWIDAFVILEAKNLLKYSNISIKEIVYRLNFPNQSVFYKYFRAHTGLTPSEYRKGYVNLHRL